MLKKIAILWVLSFALWGCEHKGLHFKAKYDQLSGLQTGDNVIFEGHDIGDVTGIAYTQEGYYLVDVGVKQNFLNAATEDSQFFIVTDPNNPARKSIQVIQKRPGGKVLEEGAVVEGSSRTESFLEPILKGFREGFDELNKELEGLSKELQRVPESEEYRQLERQLEDLAEQMKEAEKSAQEKWQKEILPRLQQEMERLREELRELLPEEKKNEPLEV